MSLVGIMCAIAASAGATEKFLTPKLLILASKSTASPSVVFPLLGSKNARPNIFDIRLLDNPHGDIDIACEACHTSEGWSPLRDTLNFNHTLDTRFAMTGRHGQAECRSCHHDLRFDRPDLEPDACSSCHLDVHQGQLGNSCQDCHTTQDFHLVEGLEIHAATTFPLTGSHLQISCESCHTDEFDGAFAPLDPTCISCHEAEYTDTAQGAVDHVAAGFPETCDACHNTLAFSGATAFDHASVSDGFGLEGAHMSLDCSACHNPGDLEPIFDPADQNDCFTCHEGDYNDTSTTSVLDHAAANLPTDCIQCHTVDTRSGAVIDHAAVSGGFGLVGAHINLDCASCHSNPDFSVPGDPGSQNDCVACHEDDHQDAHPEFPTTCLDCHGIDSWDADSFDHSVTGFALVGAHISLDCSSCHAGPDNTPIWIPESQDDCLTCHEHDHQDEHPEFPTTCLDCHTVDTWEDAQFNHEATGFPLVGVHLPLDCSSCHVLPGFELIWEPSSSGDCYTCHETDHQDAHTDFPTTCIDCHASDSWEGGTFDHFAQTGFPLLGAHTPLDCSSCHMLPGLELIWEPSSADDCLTCHEEDGNQAHTGFPTTCIDCHTVDSWEGAAFDHGTQTGFPLLGAHMPLDCSSCHLLPGFELIWDPSGPNDCFTCHEDDANQAHPGFPSTCLDCHTTDSWEDSFDHDPIFPIYSGRHQGEWATCQDCHTNPSDFMVFSCIDCHAHNRPDTDDRHDGVPGYVYASDACYSCHPDGERDLNFAE